MDKELEKYMKDIEKAGYIVQSFTFQNHLDGQQVALHVRYIKLGGPLN